MKTEYLPSFIRDLKKLKRAPIYPKIKLAIFEVIPKCQSIADLKNLKRIKGTDNAYRIRLGDYRIGIFIDNETIVFSRVLHRKDIYRYFP